MTDPIPSAPKPPWIASSLIVVCLLLLLSVPLTRQLDDGHVGLWRLPVGEPGEHGPLALDHRLLAAIDGFERGLEEGSPALARLLPWVQTLLVRLGGVGNEKTYLGRDGWLIYRPGFDYLLGPPFLDPAVLERRRRSTPSWLPTVEPDPRPALFDLGAQLERRGIRLLVLPVPTKPTPHPEALVSGLAPRQPWQNPSFAGLCAELEARGILVYDPAPSLLELARQQPAFLRSDSHWTPRAVEVVAAGLAAHLRRLGLAPAPVAAPGRWFRRPLRVTGRGDLGLMLRLPELSPEPPEAVLIETVEIQTVADRGDRLWRPDARAELLLLGDSFSNVYSVPELGWGSGGGLAEQLAWELQTGVDRLAVQDGSASEVRRRLASGSAGGRDRLEGKRAVIYQIAVRELASGDWQRVDLGGGASPAAAERDRGRAVDPR